MFGFPGVSRSSRSFSEFLGVSRSFSEFLGVSRSFPEFLGVSRSFSEFPGVSRCFSEFLEVSVSFSDFSEVYCISFSFWLQNRLCDMNIKKIYSISYVSSIRFDNPFLIFEIIKLILKTLYTYNPTVLKVAIIRNK